MQDKSGQDSGNKGEKKFRDGWDKFELLAKPLSGVLAAVTIATIGFIGQNTLITIANQSEGARLFTELQVRREESESSLRKDVFNQTLKLLLDDSGKAAAKNDPSKSLLRLELLAMNFGDTLSLAPLFTEMDRDFGKLQPTSDAQAEDWDIRIRKYKKRLHSLAKRVASAQVSAVLQKGKSFQIEIPGDYQRSTVFDWPVDAVRNEFRNQPDWLNDDALVAEAGRKKSQMAFDDVILNFYISFSDFDRNEKTVRADLTIEQILKQKDGSLTPVEDNINREFTLNYYNFPMIDNTRLSRNRRFALVLEDFKSAGVSVRGMVFPGQYSSHRDRPFLSDAIEDLKRQFSEGAAR